MAQALVLKVNGTTLPGGVVAFTRNDELLWSEGTGRSADSGLMVGTVVAAKAALTVQWGIITDAEYTTIYNLLRANSFFTFSSSVNGAAADVITAYSGAITGEYIGKAGGVGYWRDVRVDIIER